MKRLLFEEIRTDRLILRELKQKDFASQYDFLKDKNNFPFADYPIAQTHEDVKAHFDRMMKEQLVTSLFWIIADKTTDKAVGTMSAWNVDFVRNSIEFGYCLYQNQRGKGYMREALSAVMAYCHDRLGFTEMDIWTDHRNISSRKLVESLGFVSRGNEEEKAKFSPGNITYATYTRYFR